MDEVIKMTVVRDMLQLTHNSGFLPADDDTAKLGSWMPVVSRRTEHRLSAPLQCSCVPRLSADNNSRLLHGGGAPFGNRFHGLMVQDRVRQVMVSCAGLRFDGGSIDASSFQRVGRRLKVGGSWRRLLPRQEGAGAGRAP